MRQWLWAALALAGCFRVVRPEQRPEAPPGAGEFPHELLSAALAGRVDEEGLVDYAAIRDDRGKLDEFLGYVAEVSPESDPELFPTRQDQLAYYINAYNGLAIQGVIDRPGLKSVDDIKVEFFYYTRYLVGGRKLDLYRLENSVVRPTFSDPRVHFALNCQSGGCPRLPQAAFDPELLDEQLDAVTHEFVTHPGKVRVEDGLVKMSQIFEWYAEDFVASGGAIKFANQHGAGLPEDLPLEFIPYDWSLTAQPGRGP
jgi:hypothetical protein